VLDGDAGSLLTCDTIPVADFKHATPQPHIMHSRSAHHSFSTCFKLPLSIEGAGKVQGLPSAENMASLR
jgi:hypothetical protein